MTLNDDENKCLKRIKNMKIIILIAMLVCIIVLFLAYFGLFSSVNFTESKSNTFTVVYKTIIGDYRQSGAVMDEVFYFLKHSHGVETTKGFGFYFDNPQKTKTENLRSIAGCIADIKINKSEIEKAGFKTVEVQGANAYATTFPYKSKFSIMFSLFKVYPALSKKLADEGKDSLPVIEIYDVPEKKIKYIIFKDIPAEEIVSRYYK